ncbi:MAG: type II toxin-antitoxin system RelE/ParE family toxin [Steroidobacteraceae bacterium]
MIKTFANDVTERIFRGEAVDSVTLAIQQQVLVKLQILHAANSLADLEAISSNHLELLDGAREGYHCVRVGDVARVCFRWEKGHAYEVELFEHH